MHTGQGYVYSSRAFAKAHEQYARCHAGTPTDNPVIEAVNGRIKQEMRLDFSLHLCGNLQAAPDEFVFYYNHIRPALALNYRSPVQFRIEQGF